METSTAPNHRDVGSIRIRQEIPIKGSREKVFKALTSDVSSWWGAPYLNGDAKKLIIEPRLGGLFFEDWGNCDGAVWGRVTQWKKNEIFEFTGPCGMGGAVHGVVCFTLEGDHQSTLLKLEHGAVGHVTEKTQQMYGEGWKDLLSNRLKSFVETGVKQGLDA